jgi:hypothetical protein
MRRSVRLAEQARVEFVRYVHRIAVGSIDPPDMRALESRLNRLSVAFERCMSSVGNPDLHGDQVALVQQYEYLISHLRTYAKLCRLTHGRSRDMARAAWLILTTIADELNEHLPALSQSVPRIQSNREIADAKRATDARKRTAANEQHEGRRGDRKRVSLNRSKDLDRLVRRLDSLDPRATNIELAHRLKRHVETDANLDSTFVRTVHDASTSRLRHVIARIRTPT